MNHLIGKILKTKGGLNVRIIAFEETLGEPIIGILLDAYGDGLDSLEQWKESGKYWDHLQEDGHLDLILE